MCKQDKPQEEFDPSPGRRPFGLSSHCKTCDAERKKKLNRKWYWDMTDEERSQFNRRQNLKKFFGITPEQYDELFDEQDGVCAICKQPEVVEHHSTNEVQCLTVDHDHATGLVRGLLCTKCNKGIGLLRDNPVFLRNAASYLEKDHGHKANQASRPRSDDEGRSGSRRTSCRDSDDKRRGAKKKGHEAKAACDLG